MQNHTQFTAPRALISVSALMVLCSHTGCRTKRTLPSTTTMVESTDAASHRDATTTPDSRLPSPTAPQHRVLHGECRVLPAQTASLSEWATELSVAATSSRALVIANTEHEFDESQCDPVDGCLGDYIGSENAPTASAWIVEHSPVARDGFATSALPLPVHDLECGAVQTVGVGLFVEHDTELSRYEVNPQVVPADCTTNTRAVGTVFVDAMDLAMRDDRGALVLRMANGLYLQDLSGLGAPQGSPPP